MLEWSGPQVTARQTAPKASSTPTGAFTVVMGSCTVDSEGCLLSPNYPGNYSMREECIITVNPNATGPVQVVDFHTEQTSDVLVVNGVHYSGNRGPVGVYPMQDMLWFSDFSIVSTGFKVCPTPYSAEVAEHAQKQRTNLTVVAGFCTVGRNGCVMSPHYPEPYHSDSACTINATGSTPLHVVNFQTEEMYDTLTVNNRDYSGTHGPEGVVPHGQIAWAADYSLEDDGWKICPTEVTTESRTQNSTFFTVQSGFCARSTVQVAS